MYDNYAGKLIFKDEPLKFYFQKNRIESLTKENDIYVGTTADNKYLLSKISAPGQLTEDTFQKSANNTDKFACMKIGYDEIKPYSLFDCVAMLRAFYDHNCNVENKPQSYYKYTKDKGYKEISKDEFFKS